MIDDWSPATLAKLSLIIMAIPAGLTVLAVLISIAMGKIIDIAGIDKESEKAIKMDKAAGNIFYVAYISVGVLNFMMLGLFISAVWALVNFIIKLFSGL